MSIRENREIGRFIAWLRKQHCCCLAKIARESFVAKLVKSFGTYSQTTESLDDFRYAGILFAAESC